MSDHPMSETVPAMIEAVGIHDALAWWMRWGHDWPSEEAIHYSREAINAMVRDDPDHIINDLDGQALARAFQWVRIFSLEPFVEASRVVPS